MIHDRFKNLLLGACTLFLSGSVVVAGIDYTAEQVTRTEGKKEEFRMLVHGQFEGDSARVEFIETPKAQPMLKAGHYLVTTDGGETVYLVNPDEKSYYKFDLSQLLSFAGDLMESMSGMMKIEISDPEVTVHSEGSDGGSIHGMSTKFYKFDTSYSISTKVLGMQRTSEIESQQELWTSDEVNQAAFDVWMSKTPMSGNPDIDKMIEAETGKLKMVGFPIKSRTVTTTRQMGRKGKLKDESTGETTMDITEWNERAIPASVFEIDPSYTELAAGPLGLPGQPVAEEGQDSSDQPEEKKKGRLRSLFKKR